MIKAIFLELDGTLCNTHTALWTAQSETFQVLRKWYPKVAEETFIEAWMTINEKLDARLKDEKCSMAEVRDSRFEYLFRELKLPIDKVMEELNDFFFLRFREHLGLYQDVTVLEKLQAYHVGIVTNGAHDDHIDSQITKVRYLGLTDYIQSLTISDEVGVRKPDIKIFQIACERAGVSPEEAVFVGDSIEKDILGANRAGMVTMFIDRRFDLYSVRIGDRRPDYLTSDLNDILSCAKVESKK